MLGVRNPSGSLPKPTSIVEMFFVCMDKIVTFLIDGDKQQT